MTPENCDVLGEKGRTVRGSGHPLSACETGFTLPAIACLVVATLALAACSSGGQGGVNIGSGQKPDPVVLDFPIAYVSRPLPAGTEDARRLLDFQGGADIWLRDRAAPASAERNITADITGGEWDVRDLDVSVDGQRLLFSMRAPPIEGLEDSEQPTWNIFEYDVASGDLRRVIASDLVAEEGHDLGPGYLPDGRIVFTSTRQRQSRAVLIDEGKPQYAALGEDRDEWAFVLHVMNPDGSGIRQISFNQSHDLDPAVLQDGRIVFSRWDNAAGNGMHLYTVNPDGSGMELLYGANSHDAGEDAPAMQFLAPRPAPDGRVIALVRPFDGTQLGGDPQAIDVAAFVENTQPVLDHAGLPGPAQQRLVSNDVQTVPGISPGGRYASAFPLWDGTGRLLTSWSLCRAVEQGRIVPCTEERLADPALQPAAPLYGIFVWDPRDGTQRPVLEPVEGRMFTEVVAMMPRMPMPAVILDAVAGVDYDAELAEENVGILKIRSVYDIDGTDTAPGGIGTVRDPARTTAAQRPARFLRIEKPVAIPDRETLDFPGSAFGAAGGLGMREIIGYVPVEPDGSAMLKLPAGVAFAVTVLDGNARRISPAHRNWLQLRAGEVVACNGCHEPAAAQDRPIPRSHGRSGLFRAANPGAPTTGLPFPNTVPALFADQGETMAETRARISCQTDCAALAPSADVVFEDPWTDAAAAGRAPDAPFSYRYSDLQTVAPVSAGCQPSWTPLCRITIHYPDHIQPLWDLDRRILDADGVTVLEDRSCLACHSPRDAQGQPRVPAGQLDLSGEPSPEESDHLVSYRELLFGDNEQELAMGALQDVLVPGPPDPVTGEPTLVPVPVPAAASAAGAIASTRFLDRFAPGGGHEGYLSAAELRLISEWLDIGAQYYNDPFAVPVD